MKVEMLDGWKCPSDCKLRGGVSLVAVKQGKRDRENGTKLLLQVTATDR
jgi:hypothetical protein